MSRIDEIKARASDATPGPWVHIPDKYDPGSTVPWGDPPSGEPAGVKTTETSWIAQYVLSDREAAFIACAREDIPWLCAEVERLEAENTRLNEYADKLAAGLPEGMLPKDIENIKAANWKLAEENARLREALENAKLEMIRFGNIAEWPPEMSMSYAEAINKLKEALKGGDA